MNKEGESFYVRPLSIISIACVGIIVYANTFLCPFHFDDMPSIVDNPAIRHIIKMKGTKEGVGIDNNAYTSNAYYRKRPDIKRLPLLIHEGILLSGQG